MSETTAKHTPGPWKSERLVHGDGIVTQAIKADPGTVAHTAFGNVSEAACEANSRLIAAAPELLEACKAMLEAYDVPRRCCVLARTAISKAEGWE